MQGICRYDEPAYRRWLAQHHREFLGYLKVTVDCLELGISDGVLRMGFLPDMGDSTGPNDQAVSRLRRLRSALPLCERYQSYGIWPLPEALMPSFDETRKDIPRESLPLWSDVQKNVAWRKTVERRFLPDGYYSYQRAWYALRQDAFLYVQGLVDGLRHMLQGRPFNFAGAFENGRLLERLAQDFRNTPDPPLQTPDAIRSRLVCSSGKWSTGIQTFYVQATRYAADLRDADAGRLAVANFRNAMADLKEMRRDLGQLLSVVPDYLHADDLSAREDRATRSCRIPWECPDHRSGAGAPTRHHPLY